MVIVNVSKLSSMARRNVKAAGYSLKTGERKKRTSSSSKSKQYLVTTKGTPIVEVSSGFADKYKQSVKELQAREQNKQSSAKSYSQLARETSQMRQRSYQDTALMQSVDPKIKTYRDIGIEKQLEDYRQLKNPMIRALTTKESKTLKRVQRFEPIYQFKEAAKKGAGFQPYAAARSGSAAQTLGYASGLVFSIATIGGATGSAAGRGLAAASTRSRAAYGLLSGASKVSSYRPISLGLKTLYGASVVGRGVSAVKRDGATGLARVGFTTARDISFLGSTSRGFKEGIRSSIGYSRVRSSTLYDTKYSTPKGQVAKGSYRAVLNQPYSRGYSIVKSRVTALTPKQDLIKAVYGRPLTLRKGQTYSYAKGVVFDVKPRLFRKPKISTRTFFSMSKAKTPSILDNSVTYRSTGFGYSSDLSKFKAITTQKPLKPISTNKYIKSVSSIKSTSVQKGKSGYLVFEEKGLLKEIGIDKQFTAFKGSKPSIKPSSKPSDFGGLVTKQQSQIKVFDPTPKPSVDFGKLINVPSLNVEPFAIPVSPKTKQSQALSTSLIIDQKPKQKPKQKLKVVSSVRPILEIKSSIYQKSRFIVQSKPVLRSASTSKAATSMMSTTSQVTSVIPAIQTFISSPVPQAPTSIIFSRPLPFSSPLFDLDFGRKKKKKKLKKVYRKQLTDYAPSLFASAFKIKAPKGTKRKGKFTGLEIRGLLK